MQAPHPLALALADKTKKRPRPKPAPLPQPTVGKPSGDGLDWVRDGKNIRDGLDGNTIWQGKPKKAGAGLALAFGRGR